MKPEHARVLLVGASGGLGQAMTNALLASGARVLGASRSAQPTADMPGGLDLIQADINASKDRLRLAQEVRARQINVVVLASGQACFGPLTEVSEEAMSSLVQTNLTSPMLLCRDLLPSLRLQPKSQLILVGSVLGRIGLPGYGVYGASKAALHAFAEGLRREESGGSVRVQLLGPRATRTAFNDARALAYAEETGSGMDTPQDVAHALLQLIEHEGAERYLGFPEKWAVRLNGLFGAHMDKAFAKHRKALSR